MTKCEDVKEQADHTSAENILPGGQESVTEFKISVTNHKVCVTNLMPWPKGLICCLDVQKRSKRERGYIIPASDTGVAVVEAVCPGLGLLLSRRMLANVKV